MSIVPKQPFGLSGQNDPERAKAVGKYVHEKSGSYYLELEPSGNFVLFEDSEVIGTYEVNGSGITLFVARKPIATAKLEDGWIIDDQGDRWVRSSAPPITQEPLRREERSSAPITQEPLRQEERSSAPPITREPLRQEERSSAPPITREPLRQEEPASAAAKLLGDIAPKLVQLTDDVLFADVWERKELSKRDRSLITVAALVALNRPDQLRFHLGRAVENGVLPQELIEAITHLAFYSGWPNAMTAMTVAKEFFPKAG
jgi:4-carboxymuconolactone decarboxylase